MLEQQSLSAVELLVQDSQSSLNLIVLDALSLTVRFAIFLLVIVDHLIDLAQVGSLRNITERRVAVLSNDDILIFKREHGECLPICLGLGVHIERV